MRRIPLIIASGAVRMAITVEGIHRDFGIPPPKGRDNNKINCHSERSVSNPRPVCEVRRTVPCRVKDDGPNSQLGAIK